MNLWSYFISVLFKYLDNVFLFKMEIFKDKRLEKPFFKTIAEHKETGPALYTQDLNFFEKIRKLDYRCAVDTRVVLAHMDLATGAIY